MELDRSSGSSSSLSLHTIPDEDLDKFFGAFDYLDHSVITPLMIAVAENRLDEFKELLQRDVNINNVDNKGFTVLHYAVEHKNADVLEMLLAHPDIRVDAQDHRGHTALFYACQDKWFRGIKALVDAGCSINIVCNDGGTPLQILIVKAHVSPNFWDIQATAQYLLDRGAVINMSVIHMLFSLSFGPSEDLFMELFYMFLAYGMDLNGLVDEFGRKPVIKAINYKHAQVLNYLLDYITVYDEIINDCEISYYLAILNIEGVDYVKLTEAGADINFCTRSLSSLTIAARMNEEMFEFFWKRCDLEYIFRNHDFLDNFLKCCRLRDFPRIFYMMMESPHAEDIVATATGQTYECIIDLFQELRVKLEDRTKILCTLLSYDNVMSCRDFHKYHQLYGVASDFKAFFQAGASITGCNFFKYYSIGLYCYPAAFVKMRIHDFSGPFPTLAELCRDVVRFSVSEFVDLDETTITLDYFHRISQLQIPEHLKDFIAFKGPEDFM